MSLLSSFIPSGTTGGGGATYQTGDIAYSLDQTHYALPDWLPCDGQYRDTATTPAALRPLLAKAYTPSYVLGRDPESPGVAPTSVLDINDSYALVQFSATPYARWYKKKADGVGTYEYDQLPITLAPTGALKCAALDDNGNALLFTSAASSAMYRKNTSGSISGGAVDASFTGVTAVGCAYGADGRWYVLQTTAPFLRSWNDPQNGGTVRPEGGFFGTPLGLCISPNRKYMCAWASTAPYVFIYEFDGTRYAPLGSPSVGSASFTRVEISDTGVFVGKPSTGSVFYVGHVSSLGVGNMLQSTVNAATAWGVTPDGRYLLTWVSSSAQFFSIQGDVIDPTATAISTYSSVSHGTLYQRPGLTSGGQLLWGASGASYGYALCAKATPDGFIAPSIRNGFMKA